MTRKPDIGFHSRMLRYSGPDSHEVSRLVEGHEVAKIVVDETWKLGKYQKPEVEKMREVWKRWKSSPSFKGPERAALARSRLREKREVRDGVVLPESVVDCLTGCHFRGRITSDFFIEYDPCELCDKIQERRMFLRRYGSLMEGIAHAHFLKRTVLGW
jgi:hypothetical protein